MENAYKVNLIQMNLIKYVKQTIEAIKHLKTLTTPLIFRVLSNIIFQLIQSLKENITHKNMYILLLCFVTIIKQIPNNFS